jgi:hypothetical protein
LQDGEKPERKDILRDEKGSGSVAPAITVNIGLQTIFLECVG